MDNCIFPGFFSVHRFPLALFQCTANFVLFYIHNPVYALYIDIKMYTNFLLFPFNKKGVQSVQQDKFAVHLSNLSKLKKRG